MTVLTGKSFGAAALAATLATTASAGTSIVIDESFGADTIKAGDFSSYVFGGETSPNFTHAALQGIHNELAADGVDTEDKLTILAAETDNGLALFFLFDKEKSGYNGLDDSISFSSTINHSGGVGWINDANQDIQVGPIDFGAATAAGGTVTWDSDNRGDAFAWSGLEKDDGITATFSGNTFFDEVQFATFDSVDGWSLLSETKSFTESGTLVLDFVVVPSPVAVLGAIPMLGLIAVRRRRNA